MKSHATIRRRGGLLDGADDLAVGAASQTEYGDQICMALNGDVLAGWGPKRDAAFDGRVAVPGNLNTFSRW